MDFLAYLKEFLLFLLAYSLCMSTLAGVGAVFRYRYLIRKEKEEEAAVKSGSNDSQNDSSYYYYFDGSGNWQIGQMDEKE